MNINKLKNSNFLTKEDVGPGMLVTVSGCSEENVAMTGAPEELRWCLHVEEFEKPMVLNSTNGQLIAQALGSQESDDWVGKKIVLYNDPSVTYAGKVVGGIRARAPKKTAPTPVPVPKKAAPAQVKPVKKQAVEEPTPDELGAEANADLDVPF